MKKTAALQLLLAACATNGGGATSGPHAALQVTFGTGPTAALDASVVSNTTSSRLMLQSSDTHTTVFVSLALPLPAQEVMLAPDAQDVSIWAKQGATPPLIATSGALTITRTGGRVEFGFSNISKPMDSTGASLTITGSMMGVATPQ